MKQWDADVWISFIAVVFVITMCLVGLAGCADAKATATINMFGPQAVPTSPAPEPTNPGNVVIVDVAPVETTLIGTVPTTPDPVPFNPPVVPAPAPATPSVSSDTCDKRGRGDGNGTPGNGKGQGDDKKGCR
jgi:hypothetical protein